MQILDLIENFKKQKILQIVQLRERQAMFALLGLPYQTFFEKNFTQSLKCYNFVK